jgi:phenol hydroxylase P3 protein
LSHQAWNVFYNYAAAAPFHTWTPSAQDMDWLAAKYPDSFDKHYRPLWEHYAEMANKAAIASTARRCPCCARSA